MKKTRRTTEQIIRILRDSEGLSVDEACRKHEISAPTYHRWKAKYGGMGIKEAQDCDFRPVAQGLLPELRFGGGSSDTKFAAFSGYIDEVGLWGRGLTAVEIQRQFKSALTSSAGQLAQLVQSEDI